MDYDRPIEIVEEDSLSLESNDALTDKYARKYENLAKRCESIQRENLMIIARMMKIKKQIHRLRKERKFLIRELDKRGDDFRNIPINFTVNDEETDAVRENGHQPIT